MTQNKTKLCKFTYGGQYLCTYTYHKIYTLKYIQVFISIIAKAQRHYEHSERVFQNNSKF